MDPSPSQSSLLSVEFIAGAVAGSIIAAATCPLENAKVIQQTSAESLSTSSWLKKMHSYGGISSLYRGILPHLVQAGVGRGFYLGTYYLVKSVEDGKITPPWGWGISVISSDTTVGKVAAAAIAGVAGWTFTYPFDVVRSNMMRDWQRVKHQSTLGCILNLIKAGGVTKLYAGMWFTIIRAIPVASVALPSYDTARAILLGMTATTSSEIV